MKIGNAKNAFTILLTAEDRNMFGTTELILDIKMDSVTDFLVFYREHHPHAHGTRVSIVPNPTGDGTKSHPYRIFLNKKVSTGKWKFLNQLPMFSPETVSLSADEASGHDPWAASRPAMTTIAPQAKARRERAEQEVAKETLLPLTSLLPKVPAQIMPREDFSDTAMYKSLMDGVALVNKAMAFYGDRLTLDVSHGRLRALLEITGD